MDSINQQQPEQNKRDLQGQEAIKKIKELAEKAQTCFFCTHATDYTALTTTPMSIQKADDQGNLWFLSANDSHKNQAIQSDPRVQLLFQGSPHSDFLLVRGTATITTDKAVIKDLWEPILKTWFTGGIDDPRITAIKVESENGYYWDTKHGTAVAFVKQVAGAITGTTLDDSIEGNIHV